MGWMMKRPRTTGWQKLTPLAGVSGDLWMKRTGEFVEVACRYVSPSGTGVVDLVDIPSGFRPHAASSTRLGTISTDTGTTAMTSYFSGKFRLINASPGAFSGRIIWSTSEPWPTTLPGVPA